MRYFLKKLFSLLTTLFFIVTLTFFLMKAIPGDPFTQEKNLPKEILNALRAHYGLDDPWHQQYLRYLQSILKWDLGPSFKYKARSVNAIIREGFPISALLGGEALLIALVGGTTFGAIAALKQNHWQDYTTTLLAVSGVSIPSFVLAALLQYMLAFKLGWFPVARWGTFMQSVLPAISLAALPMAFIARLIRSNMLEVLQQDYIKTARSKGVSEVAIVFRHALRNAVLPVISYLGQLSANILTGSFIIERIFGIPGLGQWFVTSVANRDYTVIMGTTVFYSLILLTTVFLVDIFYGFLDPRIKQVEN